jgi:hypothetical protein
MRRGYAMLAVLVFLAVGLTLIGVNQRHIGSLLRLDQARVEATDFREGPVQVMAKALALLETGLPPSNPYLCGVTVDTSDGPRSFSVDFSWGAGPVSVEVAPTTDAGSLVPMPPTFAP